MTEHKHFAIDLEVDETEEHTEAVATLRVGSGHFVGRGVARRNPDDPDVPAIGDELAIARALVAVANGLNSTVDSGIEVFEGRQVHVDL